MPLVPEPRHITASGFTTLAATRAVSEGWRIISLPGSRWMGSIGNHQEGDIDFANHPTVKWLLMPLKATGFFIHHLGNPVNLV